MYYVILEDIDSVIGHILPCDIISHAQMLELVASMEGCPIPCQVFASEELAEEWLTYIDNL